MKTIIIGRLIIAEFIKHEWGQHYTIRGVSRLLEDLGLTYSAYIHPEKSR
ncbi:winged helix-turn-helix domain-containing protein [Heyndrickxia faecalis]